MYEYAVERKEESSGGTSARTASTTPRRNDRGWSLGSARAEREVEAAGERRRADAGERDEREDPAARRTLNDPPDPPRDGRAEHHQRSGEQRTAERERMVPDDRGRDAEKQSGECPPGPAYRRRPAHRERDRGNDERDVRRRVGEERAEPEDEERPGVEAAQQAERKARAERDERHEQRTEPGDVVLEIDAHGVLEGGLGGEHRNARDEAHDLGADVVHERPGHAFDRARQDEEPEDRG